MLRLSVIIKAISFLNLLYILINDEKGAVIYLVNIILFYRIYTITIKIVYF